MSPPVFNCFRNSIIPEPVGFMLYFCQKLLNFQGTQALIQVRSLSFIIKDLRDIQYKAGNLSGYVKYSWIFLLT